MKKTSFDYEALIADGEKLKQGVLAQFANPLTLTGLGPSLGKVSNVLFDLSQICNMLWLPRYLGSESAGLITQDKSIILGIRVNQLQAPMLIWGLTGDMVVTFTGPIRRIYVTQLGGNFNVPITLLAATGVGVGYSSSAANDGTAPSVPSIDGYRLGGGVTSGGSTTGGASTDHVNAGTFHV